MFRLNHLVCYIFCLLRLLITSLRCFHISYIIPSFEKTKSSLWFAILADGVFGAMMQVCLLWSPHSYLLWCYMMLVYRVTLNFFGKSCLQRWLSGYVYNFCVSCTKWAGRLFDIEWAVNLQVHLVNDGPVTMNLDSRKTSNVDSDETVGTQKMWVSSQTWNVQWCPHY